ncbi:hypothetical protein GCM10022227_01020 [Streptomyces sedi]
MTGSPSLVTDPWMVVSPAVTPLASGPPAFAPHMSSPSSSGSLPDVAAHGVAGSLALAGYLAGPVSTGTPTSEPYSVQEPS